MKRRMLTTAVFGCLLFAGIQAQIVVDKNAKCNPFVSTVVSQAAQPTQGLNGKTAVVAEQAIIIDCYDAETVCKAISKAGYEATFIDATTVTATVPATYIATLSEMSEVKYISASMPFRPFMEASRKASKVDDIHNGTDLETPFTGKGVIVGVIDQGFQFKHRAFLNEEGESRALAIWKHKNAYTRPTTVIPNTGDEFQGSHATHVTNIACGSQVGSNKLYGMAPEADIVMISSTFDNARVMEEAKYISELAASEGKPYVINMSFGSQQGPHDGTTKYDQTMKKYGKAGGILVAAMGNEGTDNLHTTCTFEEDEESVNIFVKDIGQSTIFVDLWGQATDGKQHLQVRPFVYNISTKVRDFKNDSFWKSCGNITATIDPNNKKENYYFAIQVAAMRGSSTNLIFGVEVTGNTDDTFHAWIGQPEFGSFYKPIGAPNAVSGDSEYCVGEGGASIPNAIAVGSYNAVGTSFKNYFGQSFSYPSSSVGSKGQISPFSSKGPYLGEGYKPLVVAPGSCVNSAFNSKSSDWDGSSNNTLIMDIVTMGSTKYYYGLASGTSMASPAMTGIIALWLQANPQLTPENVEEIIRKTATRDNYTGSDEWNARRGYGKVDAYAGLQEALRMAADGIHGVYGSEEPVTLLKGSDAWRILFNSHEDYARINVYSSTGQLVRSQSIEAPRQGQEVITDFAGQQPGVYLINITTPKATLTRKVMVQ